MHLRAVLLSAALLTVWARVPSRASGGLGAGLGAEYPSPPGYDPRPPTEGETGSHGEGEVHEAAVSSDA